MRAIQPLDYSLVRDTKDIKAEQHSRLAELAAPESAEYFARIRRFSMLDIDALELLAVFGASSPGAVLEIGPYIGGSTVAIATGSHATQRIFVTIEVGGAYPDQPFLPSTDIMADLQRNLTEFRFADHVAILQGWSHASAIRRRVAARLAGEKIGLLVVDSDGQIEVTLSLYGRYMHEACLVVIDDYLAPGARTKEEIVKPFVDRLVQEGHLREFGVYGSGTWFGQVVGRTALAAFALMRHFVRDSGYCYQVFFSSADPPDFLGDMARSELYLLEDGTRLGPAHSLHKAIRRLGRGRYSHWAISPTVDSTGMFPSCLYFSASDNSDPNTNGLSYGLEIAGSQVDLRGL